MRNHYFDKENINTSNDIRKTKTFGQEIKAKLRIPDRPLERNRLFDNPLMRVNSFELPELHLESKSKSKSVKFSEHYIEPLTRKHSTSILKTSKFTEF